MTPPVERRHPSSRPGVTAQRDDGTGRATSSVIPSGVTAQRDDAAGRPPGDSGLHPAEFRSTSGRSGLGIHGLSARAVLGEGPPLTRCPLSGMAYYPVTAARQRGGICGAVVAAGGLLHVKENNSVLEHA